jgi:hypothetical protein
VRGLYYRFSRYEPLVAELEQRQGDREALGKVLGYADRKALAVLEGTSAEPDAYGQPLNAFIR